MVYLHIVDTTSIYFYIYVFYPFNIVFLHFSNFVKKHMKSICLHQMLFKLYSNQELISVYSYRKLSSTILCKTVCDGKS